MLFTISYRENSRAVGSDFTVHRQVYRDASRRTFLLLCIFVCGVTIYFDSRLKLYL